MSYFDPQSKGVGLAFSSPISHLFFFVMKNREMEMRDEGETARRKEYEEKKKTASLNEV